MKKINVVVVTVSLMVILFCLGVRIGKLIAHQLHKSQSYQEEL